MRILGGNTGYGMKHGPIDHHHTCISDEDGWDQYKLPDLVHDGVQTNAW
jgi:hypothetical protein